MPAKEGSVSCSLALTYRSEVSAGITPPIEKECAQNHNISWKNLPLVCNLKCIQRGTRAHASVCVRVHVHTLPDIPEGALHLCQRHQLKSPHRTLSLLRCLADHPAVLATLMNCYTSALLLSGFYHHNCQKLLIMLIYLLTSCFIYCTAGVSAVQTYQAIHPGSYSESVGKPAIESISPASKFSKCLD